MVGGVVGAAPVTMAPIDPPDELGPPDEHAASAMTAAAPSAASDQTRFITPIVERDEARYVKGPRRPQ
jgi:hypothetical protein